MAHWERIQAALRGERPDRLPVSLWRHYPLYDRDAGALARRMIEFQETYDFDFIKVMLERHGPLPDWGARVRYFDPDPFTLGEMTEPLIKTVKDWGKFKPLDARRGTLARDVEAVRLIATHDPLVPVIQTVFSPFTLACKAAGMTLFDHLRADPTPVLGALEQITRTLERFVAASLEAGAWGTFYAVQAARRDWLTWEEYARWGRPYDLRVLGAGRGRKGFDILHIHGPNILFRELAEYPVDAINWEPGEGNPTIVEASKLTPKALIAGVHHEKIAGYSLPEALRAVEEAVRATGGQRFILGPTCTVQPSTAPAILRTIQRAAKEQHFQAALEA